MRGAGLTGCNGNSEIPPMETNRFIELRKVFDAAVLLPSPEWPGFLREACGRDEVLYAQAMDLLLAHRSAGTTESAGAPHPKAKRE